MMKWDGIGWGDVERRWETGRARRREMGKADQVSLLVVLVGPTVETSSVAELTGSADTTRFANVWKKKGENKK